MLRKTLWEYILNSFFDLLSKRQIAAERILKCLKSDFANADDFYWNSHANALSLQDYEDVRQWFVGEWFRKNTPRNASVQLSAEQIAAISANNKNVLLKARAGSGKTAVIANRARFMIEHANVDPDKILLLAFNIKAKDEMGKRIRKDYGISNFANARTFHSLAWELVQPTERLLNDGKSRGESAANRGQFIRECIESIKQTDFIESLYRLCREESHEFLTQGERHCVYRSNQLHLTLAGDLVKSFGEKYIGDFLFEHGIKHKYEDVRFWGAGLYRPDFSIFYNSSKPNIIIEHWGIDENAPKSKRKVPEFWDSSWHDYQQQMERKRGFWKSPKHNKDNAIFLETSIADLKNGDTRAERRANFENILRRKLTDAGVQLKKVDGAELQQSIKKIHLGKLNDMFGQFIAKAKSRRLSPDDLLAKIEQLPDGAKKAKIFSNMANSVYRAYQRNLTKSKLIDFEDLLARATNKVIETKGNCTISTSKRRPIAINQMEHLMIDEYQDFSSLFFNLVDAIRRCNPALNIFCVGDDWQAINAFAGADLKYFTKFDRYMKNAKHLSLLTNYRSRADIVDVSNQFMHNRGEQSRAHIIENGEIHKYHADKFFIEMRRAPAHAKNRAYDSRFSPIRVNGKNPDNGLVVGRMLKACLSIITASDNHGKKFAIINRINNPGYGYESLENFKRALKDACCGHPIHRNFNDRVEISTAHGFKGREADVIIMLFVNRCAYPLIHPNDGLLKVFGASPQDTLEEERRLFYVGLTRAKEKLYLLCDSENESDFLREIDANSGLADYKIRHHPPSEQ